MEQVLINQEYLKDLLSIIGDQGEEYLVSQLFKNLESSRNQFLKESMNLFDDEKKMLFEIHKLKNQFANLGCDAVTGVLDEMYSLIRQQEIDKVRHMIGDFHRISERTLELLKIEINC